MNKKIVSAVTLVSLIAALGSGCVMAKNDGIKVTYDGNTIDFDVQPEIIDDRVMVPMRAIFEAFGAMVKWDGDSQTITAKKKSKTISMTIGNTDMTKNDETYSFDTAPVIEDGRTLVPVRAVSDMLGLDVEWEDSDKTVTITTPTEEEDDSWKENTGTINLDTMETTGDGVSVSDNIITISKGGDFEVTGNLEEGQIIIDTEDKAKLRLSGMSLTNPNGAAVYVKNADKAYITITENTENTLTDGESYTSGDENEKACITSRDNLEIKGNGALTVNGNYNHGINASDSMEIGNGNITINAKNDCIHVNDTLEISGGKLTLASESKKGISAHGDIVIDDGDIDITKSTEGIETKQIMTINGGDISVIASDDGFNAGGNGMDNMRGGFGGGQRTDMQPDDNTTPSDMRGGRPMMMQDIQNGEMSEIPNDGFGIGRNSTEISTEHHIQINGGTIYINAVNDGIDSNGSLVIDGGDIIIEGSPRAGGGEMGLDTDGALIINGGDVLATGSSINTTGANQNTANINLSAEVTAGELFEIRNAEGETIASFTVSSPFSAILYSSDKLETDKEYSVYTNGEQEESFIVTDKVTTVGTAASVGFGGRGNKGQKIQKSDTETTKQ
ncbi:MAG: carbohydrate-binding domain-containing protein [Clostridia bacterium]|nr:carbohydrate-binding domain-containing protein [Clostridia bacterium]